MTDSETITPTKTDTDKLRALVDERVRPVEEALRERPTRAEVQVIASEYIDQAITKLEEERRDYYSQQAQAMARMEKMVENIAKAVDGHRQENDQKIDRVNTRIDGQDKQYDLLAGHLHSATMLANQNHLALFGAAGDGPDSVFRVMSSLRDEFRGSLTDLRDEVSSNWKDFDARLDAMETVFQVVKFLRSRTGITVVVAVASVFGGPDIIQLLQGLL